MGSKSCYYRFCKAHILYKRHTKGLST
uniref:Uncharacterized protein n=1 Tax=Anguilla anguilla TaxID=7936 RepID=A0A0E9PXB0_ANGAN